MGTLASEARNFSWASLPPGAEFRLLLVTLRGPDQSRSANASAWTRECHLPPPTPAAGPRVHLFDIVGRAAGRAAAAPRSSGSGRPAPRTASPGPALVAWSSLCTRRCSMSSRTLAPLMASFRLSVLSKDSDALRCWGWNVNLGGHMAQPQDPPSPCSPHRPSSGKRDQRRPHLAPRLLGPRSWGPGWLPGGPVPGRSAGRGQRGGRGGGQRELLGSDPGHGVRGGGCVAGWAPARGGRPRLWLDL